MNKALALAGVGVGLLLFGLAKRGSNNDSSPSIFTICVAGSLVFVAAASRAYLGN